MSAFVPKVTSSVELPISEAKWLTLKKLNYTDSEGKQRIWEVVERKTRKSSGIDAVAILAILRSNSNAFPLSTVIIEQYRPPIDKIVVELPAGLIDEGETPEEAAIRELEEETGYKADKIIESSSLVVCDPGMSNTNMKLILLGVSLPGDLEEPVQKLDPGEFITRRVVELSKLTDELKKYSENERCVVDARLSHFAFGYEMAERVKKGEFDLGQSNMLSAKLQ